MAVARPAVRPGDRAADGRAPCTIYYVVQPMPGMHVVKQIVFDGIVVLMLGVVVAFLYRSEARSAA